MDMIVNEFISQYGVTIIYAIITAVVSYIGVQLKNLVAKYMNDKTKREVAKMCVKAIEQIYHELHGKEKLDKCIESISSILNDKGIPVTEIEIRMLVEYAVKEMNEQFSDIFNTEDAIADTAQG